MTPPRAQASINVAAIERNCVRLRRELAGGAELCAVVKADGYGHGALASAEAALAGGAGWLAVATAQEARELRDGDLQEAPILVMGALTLPELAEALAVRADVVVWSEAYVRAVADAGGGRVHVKLDSGMGRLGTRDAEHASRVLAAAHAASSVEAVGVMSHFATADELDDDGFFDAQLETFTRWAAASKQAAPELIVHAANSAAALRNAASHFDMARCGIAVYGMDPFGVDASARELEPALELSSYVAEVKPCRAGESAGYGRRFIAERDTCLGVLPIGYGDGWRRGLSNNADVLIGGARYPLVGTISMDNVTVELGLAGEPEQLRGARATLIGSDGPERITAEEIARHLATINYEVTCALSSRVTRAYHRDGSALEPGSSEPELDGAGRRASVPSRDG